MNQPAENTSIKPHPWWQGLRALAVGWTIVPLTLMLILAISATAVVLQATVKQLSETSSHAKAQLTALQLTDQLSTYRQVFQIITQDHNLPALSTQEAENILNQHSALLTDFVVAGDIIIYDTQGVVTATYPPQPSLIGQTRPAFNIYQTSTNHLSPEYSDIVIEPDSERQFVGLRGDFYDQSGQKTGFIVGRLFLDQHPFSRYLFSWQGENNQSIFLVDQQGQAIFHSNLDQIGQNLQTNEAVERLQTTIVSAAYTDTDDNGIREVIAYAPISGTNWGLVVTTPWSQIIQPTQRSLWFIAIVLALGIGSSLLIVFWGVNRISTPLRQLVSLTGRIASGHYDSQVNLSQITEIKDLGTAFNHMVSQLSSYRSGLQEYVAAITDTQEEERKRIARDLHDGTVQSLIAIGQRIELTRDSLEEVSLTESQAQLSELRSMVTQTIASVRQFSRDLRPLALEDLGLIPALQFLTNRLTQDADIQIKLEIEGEAIGLNPDLETTIYRLVQESLSNIRKHAQATQVRIIVRFLARQTVLEVHDNGIGFDVPQSTTDLAHTGSFGLLGMEERANLFGGDLFLQSARNQGSIIRVVLPHKQLPRRILDIPL
ncbi:MAG: cache domain-containing protein [Chloroflexota bacterium]